MVCPELDGDVGMDTDSVMTCCEDTVGTTVRDVAGIVDVEAVVQMFTPGFDLSGQGSYTSIIS